jgi:hypothetical protein
MAMTSNADAGMSSPDSFHPEGLYAVRFDTNGDAREEVVFKFPFGVSEHAAGEKHRHVQPLKVFHAKKGRMPGIDGEVVAEGWKGETIAARYGNGQIDAPLRAIAFTALRPVD